MSEHPAVGYIGCMGVCAVQVFGAVCGVADFCWNTLLLGISGICVCVQYGYLVLFVEWLTFVGTHCCQVYKVCVCVQYGYLVLFVEWLTFVGTHCRGANWKIPEQNFPWLVTRVMANGKED